MAMRWRNFPESVRPRSRGAWPSFLPALLLLALLTSPAACARRPPIGPNPRLTPGDVLAVTKKDICIPGYARKVRNVPAAVKRQVYEEYGILSHPPGEYEVDHLISLELGGSNRKE